MREIKKGDIVSRNSYKNDIMFEVKRILKLVNEKKIAILKGIDVRVEADAPIEDFVTEESVYEIYTAPDEDFRTTRDFLRDKDYTFISAEEEQVPSSYTSIDNDEAKDKMQRLLDMLEDDDDVQNVYHNWDEE